MRGDERHGLPNDPGLVERDDLRVPMLLGVNLLQPHKPRLRVLKVLLFPQRVGTAHEGHQSARLHSRAHIGVVVCGTGTLEVKPDVGAVKLLLDETQGRKLRFRRQRLQVLLHERHVRLASVCQLARVTQGRQRVQLPERTQLHGVACGHYLFACVAPRRGTAGRGSLPAIVELQLVSPEEPVLPERKSRDEVADSGVQGRFQPRADPLLEGSLDGHRHFFPRLRHAAAARGTARGHGQQAQKRGCAGQHGDPRGGLC
mmetsp:Transcript_2040/g.4917  ORF Transcript_2040/g.4917 Transcript_2040/m.4917 type:complete len:258 (+) Transcript_2040:809-1582(+)